MAFVPRKVTSRTPDCARLTRSTRDREDSETESTKENYRQNWRIPVSHC